MSEHDYLNEEGEGGLNVRNIEYDNHGEHFTETIRELCEETIIIESLRHGRVFILCYGHLRSATRATTLRSLKWRRTTIQQMSLPSNKLREITV